MPLAEALHPPVLCLTGATATGKSEIALLLAERLRGEIISVDSMQVYRGLDVGTAKPGDTERRCVPHHLLDVAELTESFDAAKFARLAHIAVREIRMRGRLPVFCGGTGLYFKAFLDGLGEAPPTNATLRAELEATPLADLLGELERRDPVAFDAIDRKNPRRVVRAVEVIRLTGKPFSEQRASWPKSPALLPSDASKRALSRHFFGIMRETEDLHRRINARVDRMFQRGLVEEVRGLLLRGLAANRTAMQAIGYRQVVEFLRGERPLPETIELVKIRTRQFAKRQMTWFRGHAHVNWINVGPDESPEAVAGRILSALQTR